MSDFASFQELWKDYHIPRFQILEYIKQGRLIPRVNNERGDWIHCPYDAHEYKYLFDEEIERITPSIQKLKCLIRKAEQEENPCLTVRHFDDDGMNKFLRNSSIFDSIDTQDDICVNLETLKDAYDQYREDKNRVEERMREIVEDEPEFAKDPKEWKLSWKYLCVNAKGAEKAINSCLEKAVFSLGEVLKIKGKQTIINGDRQAGRIKLMSIKEQEWETARVKAREIKRDNPHLTAKGMAKLLIDTRGIWTPGDAPSPATIEKRINSWNIGFSKGRPRK
jgi:hypothetical protein